MEEDISLKIEIEIDFFVALIVAKKFFTPLLFLLKWISPSDLRQRALEVQYFFISLSSLMNKCAYYYTFSFCGNSIVKNQMSTCE